MPQGCARAPLRRCFPVFTLVVLASSVSAGPVAQLNGVDGLVLVDDGAGFSKGREGGILVPGQRLFVTEGAAALVDFDDGCRIHVRANTLYNLPKTSPCGRDGQDGARRMGPHYAAAIGDVAVPAEPADGQRVETEQRDGKSAEEEPWYKDYALPAALTGLAFAAFNVLSGGGSSEPGGSPEPLTNLSPE